MPARVYSCASFTTSFRFEVMSRVAIFGSCVAQVLDGQAVLLLAIEPRQMAQRRHVGRVGVARGRSRLRLLLRFDLGPLCVQHGLGVRPDGVVVPVVEDDRPRRLRRAPAIRRLPATIHQVRRENTHSFTPSWISVGCRSSWFLSFSSERPWTLLNFRGPSNLTTRPRRARAAPTSGRRAGLRSVPPRRPSRSSRR